MKVLSLLFIFAAVVCGQTTASSWLQNEKWDEGLAEIALFQGKQMKYGILRRSSLEMITVREFLDPAKLVKTDPAPGKQLVPVMKCNQIRRTRTGVYEYLQMGSAFVDRRNGGLQKISCVSAEWCGNSHATLLRKGAGYELTVGNYFNDQGLQTSSVDGGAVFYDALAMYLRQNLPQLMEGERFPVAKSLISNKPAYGVEEAHVAKVELNRVTLSFGDRTETFVFDRDELRGLKSWSSSHGEYLKRRKILFSDYWNRNQPGDERLLR